jgi:hypothetical protein
MIEYQILSHPHKKTGVLGASEGPHFFNHGPQLNEHIQCADFWGLFLKLSKEAENNIFGQKYF